MIEDVLAYVVREWEIIRGAPVSFGAMFVVAVLVSLIWRYQLRIFSKRIKLRDDQLADLQNKLNAESPDDVSDKIDALIAEVKGLSFGRWPTITEPQKAAIRERLGDLPPSSAKLIVDPDGRGVGNPLAEILRELGWQVDVMPTHSNDPGIKLYPNSNSATAIADALRECASVEATVGDRRKKNINVRKLTIEFGERQA